MESYNVQVFFTPEEDDESEVFEVERGVPEDEENWGEGEPFKHRIFK